MINDNLASEAAVSLLKRQLLFIDTVWARLSNYRDDSDWQPEFSVVSYAPRKRHFAAYPHVEVGKRR